MCLAKAFLRFSAAAAAAQQQHSSSTMIWHQLFALAHVNSSGATINAVNVVIRLLAVAAACSCVYSEILTWQ